MSSTTKKRAAAGPKKQGNLFSFFTKKPKLHHDSSQPSQRKENNECMKNVDNNENDPISSTPSAATSSSINNKNNTKPIHSDWCKLKIGVRVSVYWPDDEKYYDAKITKQRKSDSAFHLEYDDGDTEWLDLRSEKFRVLDKEQKKPKRRRIEDEDEEMEFDDDVDSSKDDDASEESDEGSVYVEEKKQTTASDDEDIDEEAQWMVTDDEDDDLKGKDVSKKNNKERRKKLVKVTRHKATTQGQEPAKVTPKAPKTLSDDNSTSFTDGKSRGTTPFGRFTAGLSSSSSATATQQQSPSPSSVTPVQSPITTSISSAYSSNASSTTKKNIGKKYDNSSTTPASYVKGAVNPAGSHVHNHLGFLRNPRDKEGRTPDQPGYDPRTLKVVPADWEKHCSKMTAAVKQWWDLKSQYFDTVLLFKTGKFYEMFHMDADIGVQVCGLSYMKGHTAHAGFPEFSYSSMANKLVLAGYKVARVEQTETPEMLKERKKKTRGANSPKVVNREVCSILTIGTRTFCYLDNSGLTQETDPSGGAAPSAAGPLLAIREILLDKNQDKDSNSDGDHDSVRPVCEYGITLVDAVRATVTIGQFADDVLRSRMNTLLTAFTPSEILIEGGNDGCSADLQSLIRSVQATLPNNAVRVEKIHPSETFPKSTALNATIRQRMERKTNKIRPWDVNETLAELHRRGYYPRASRKQESQSTRRWPKVLHAAVEGQANLALSSFGAAVFYLQRNLIDEEILSMGNVKAYVPPPSSASSEKTQNLVSQLAAKQNREEDGLATTATSETSGMTSSVAPEAMDIEECESLNLEQDVNHMALDGTTLHNLEILTNSVDHKVKGSLWSKINYTKTPHGSRLLRAWLLRPLFRKADIDRRADAVEELVAGGPAVALSEAVSVLAKCGDIERLLSRVHSMSCGAGSTSSSEEQNGENNSELASHPNSRAILYESNLYTKRKVNDFSKVLNGLQQASRIPELFAGIEINSGLLQKIVRHPDEGGCFPVIAEELDWFFNNFDAELAAKGLFGPSRGMDEAYDEACDAIERIKQDLNDFKDEMCANNMVSPRGLAQTSWKYINTKPDSKDKYLIELPANVRVPDDFIMKGKRGSGAKQVNKYRAADVEQLVQELEKAIDVQKERKARGMQLIFAKFDSKRTLWEAAAHATAVLDALGSLAQTATKAGYSRPKILDCPLDGNPCVRVIQGRHPCVESTPNSGEFVPNDLCLGSSTEKNESASRVLLLSGPNMGGKSTLLRQTCLISILAQIGSYVPAMECEITPIDRIYTRLGASDRILLGQSTFFVELAETAAALRGASRRSLVIMDELGRGTSTFDGTAIADATVKHLVQRSKCLSLFATHYHSLLDDWKENSNVRLGHMECIVEEDQSDGESSGDNRGQGNITFLYTLGNGVCPKSFGINVARLASLPEDVLTRAKRVSSDFERTLSANNVIAKKKLIIEKIQAKDWKGVEKIWLTLQQS